MMFLVLFTGFVIGEENTEAVINVSIGVSVTVVSLLCLSLVTVVVLIRWELYQ